MALRELNSQQQELYLRTYIDQLRAVYRDAQAKLIKKLGSLSITEFNRQRSEVLLQEVKGIVAGLNKEAYAWSKKAIPVSYNRGIDFAADKLKTLDVTRFVNYDAKIHTAAISVMVDSVAVDLISANESIGRVFNRFIRQTQQGILQDAQISKTIAEGMISGDTRRAVSDNILKSLRAKMENEQFISINGRDYRPDKYAELLARTRTREATSRGTINTALRYGVDLVEWDSHSEICEYCAQFAGRVYSISGTDKSFPQLKEMPPLHPNCKCVVIPVTKENIESRGQLDAIIKLSNAPSIKVDSFARFEELMLSA